MRTGSSESKNYKFYEDIVSFEDDGGRTIGGKEQDYQLIGDDFQKVFINSTSMEEDQEISLPATEGEIYNYIVYCCKFKID